MIYSLINAPTADAYPNQLGAGASLHCHGAIRVRIMVTGGAALMQTARDDPGASFSGATDLPILPGGHTYDQKVDALRFKSLAAGHPAQVQVHALTAEEIA